MKKQINFNVDGVNKVFYIKKPGPKEESVAKTEANKKFREALDSGSYLRDELNKKLMERGIWSEKDEETLINLQKEIKENLDQLDLGGIELLDAKKIALVIRDKRIQLMELTRKLRQHDINTVEGQSENTYFDTLVSLCSLDEEGNKIYKSYEDYLEQSTTDLSRFLASELASLIYDLKDDWEKELPENKFLIEYGFVDKDLNYIDDKGRKVDSQGRLVDDKGRYINEAGELVNINGERVDEEGNLIRERKPFLVNGVPKLPS
jgi:hypothetical protein